MSRRVDRSRFQPGCCNLAENGFGGGQSARRKGARTAGQSPGPAIAAIADRGHRGGLDMLGQFIRKRDGRMPHRNAAGNTTTVANSLPVSRHSDTRSSRAERHPYQARAGCGNSFFSQRQNKRSNQPLAECKTRKIENPHRDGFVLVHQKTCPRARGKAA